MELLMISSLPITVLVFSLALLSGNSLSPANVTHTILSVLKRILRWLWKERPERGGAGRIRHPRIMYRQ
ncbi:hypothetical protein ACFLYB_00320 [Chloroflexota bacterium]